MQYAALTINFLSKRLGLETQEVIDGIQEELKKRFESIAAKGRTANAGGGAGFGKSALPDRPNDGASGGSSDGKGTASNTESSEGSNPDAGNSGDKGFVGSGVQPPETTKEDSKEEQS